MRPILAIFTLSILTFSCKTRGKNKIRNDSFNIIGLPNSLVSYDTAASVRIGYWMVRNYRIKNKDTFYYHYAGNSTACIEDIQSFQMIADSTYDFIYILEVDGFKYQYSEDSVVIVDAKIGNRKYYNLSWPCQKGKYTFYIENDSLYNLNPFNRNSYDLYHGEHHNDLPRWLPYSIKQINQNEFEIQNTTPSFYPVVNWDSSTKIRTVFSKATRTFNGSIEKWIKQETQ